MIIQIAIYVICIAEYEIHKIYTKLGQNVRNDWRETEKKSNMFIAHSVNELWMAEKQHKEEENIKRDAQAT